MGETETLTWKSAKKIGENRDQNRASHYIAQSVTHRSSGIDWDILIQYVEAERKLWNVHGTRE